MAKEYTPNTPFNVPFTLLIPETQRIQGVTKKTFTRLYDTFYCSFRSFGGTEKVVNGITVIEDTATIETWYDPRIKANCNIEIEGLRYEILGKPENINMRNQFLLIKVRAVEGGA